MGSVKDLEILKKPTETEMGRGRHIYSDRYSVFDAKKMPDDIDYKGMSLCLQAANFLEEAEKIGLKTHYIGLVNENGKIIYLDEVDEPVNTMEVELVNVLQPPFENNAYNYSAYKRIPAFKVLLSPGEFIYRNSLPEGSSIFRRLEAGEITLEDLGLDHYPVSGERLKKPFLDVSTKLEPQDRYLKWKIFQDMIGLSDISLSETQRILSKSNDLTTKIADRADLLNEDGKIELIYDAMGDLRISDEGCCTLDACRLVTRKGTRISKEAARQYYNKTAWYKDAEIAKKAAKASGIEDWRTICKTPIPKMDPVLKGIISNMYTSATNGMLRKNIFDAPRIDEVEKEYLDWLAASVNA